MEPADGVDFAPIIDKLGLTQARRQSFLCCDQAKPKCFDREVLLAWDYLKRRLIELGLADHGVLRTKANCFRRLPKRPNSPSSIQRARGKSRLRSAGS